MQDVNNTCQALSLRSRERERESKRRAALVGVGVLLAIVAVLVSPLGGSLVSAIQNIFIDGSQIVDIQVGGEKIDQVVYLGEVIWERARPIQEYTSANCPAARTKAYDARDGATYWIQRLADERCWMLTNLAYGGGGDGAYNDTKTVVNGSTLDYTQPFYYVPAGANRTVGVDPSESKTGTGQYGYLYNWCAAMGGQVGTAACLDVATPLPDQSVSICPSGWRLPTGGTGGEYDALNVAVNNGSVGTPSGLLFSWFGMYGGHWYDGFVEQGYQGRYWSSTQHDVATRAYPLNFNSGGVYIDGDGNGKRLGLAVRCLAL